jgi:hypothetical protein
LLGLDDERLAEAQATHEMGLDALILLLLDY